MRMGFCVSANFIVITICSFGIWGAWGNVIGNHLLMDRDVLEKLLHDYQGLDPLPKFNVLFLKNDSTDPSNELLVISEPEWEELSKHPCDKIEACPKFQLYQLKGNRIEETPSKAILLSEGKGLGEKNLGSLQYRFTDASMTNGHTDSGSVGYIQKAILVPAKTDPPITSTIRTVPDDSSRNIGDGGNTLNGFLHLVSNDGKDESILNKVTKDDNKSHHEEIILLKSQKPNDNDTTDNSGLLNKTLDITIDEGNSGVSTSASLGEDNDDFDNSPIQGIGTRLDVEKRSLRNLLEDNKTETELVESDQGKKVDDTAKTIEAINLPVKLLVHLDQQRDGEGGDKKQFPEERRNNQPITETIMQNGSAQTVEKKQLEGTMNPLQIGSKEYKIAMAGDMALIPCDSWQDLEPYCAVTIKFQRGKLYGATPDSENPVAQCVYLVPIDIWRQTLHNKALGALRKERVELESRLRQEQDDLERDIRNRLALFEEKIRLEQEALSNEIKQDREKFEKIAQAERTMKVNREIMFSKNNPFKNRTPPAWKSSDVLFQPIKAKKSIEGTFDYITQRYPNLGSKLSPRCILITSGPRRYLCREILSEEPNHDKTKDMHLDSKNSGNNGKKKLEMRNPSNDDTIDNNKDKPTMDEKQENKGKLNDSMVQPVKGPNKSDAPNKPFISNNLMLPLLSEGSVNELPSTEPILPIRPTLAIPPKKGFNDKPRGKHSGRDTLPSSWPGDQKSAKASKSGNPPYHRSLEQNAKSKRSRHDSTKSKKESSSTQGNSSNGQLPIEEPMVRNSLRHGDNNKPSSKKSFNRSGRDDIHIYRMNDISDNEEVEQRGVTGMKPKRSYVDRGNIFRK